MRLGDSAAKEREHGISVIKHRRRLNSSLRAFGTWVAERGESLAFGCGGRSRKERDDP